MATKVFMEASLAYDGRRASRQMDEERGDVVKTGEPIAEVEMRTRRSWSSSRVPTACSASASLPKVSRARSRDLAGVIAAADENIDALVCWRGPPGCS